jgi:hypothetical protein
MDQLIEIMRFSMPLFLTVVFGPSCLDAVQTPESGYSKKNHDSSSVKKFKIHCLAMLEDFKKLI